MRLFCPSPVAPCGFVQKKQKKQKKTEKRNLDEYENDPFAEPQLWWLMWMFTQMASPESS